MRRKTTGPTPDSNQAWSEARQELKRAYLLVSWGKFDDAIEACDRAERCLKPDQDPLPGAIRGSILTAAGRIDDALAELRDVTRQWETNALAHLYFAEACLISGRKRHARRALSKARRHDDGTHDEFIDHLDSLIDGSLPVGDPLVVEKPDTQSEDKPNRQGGDRE